MKEKHTKLVYSTDPKVREQISAESGNDIQHRDEQPSQQTIRISLQTKGRKGKKVTLASGFIHSPEKIKEIARLLKQACGAGGTVKNDTIEIQGDKREQVAQFLKQKGYQIKGA